VFEHFRDDVAQFSLIFLGVAR